MATPSSLPTAFATNSNQAVNVVRPDTTTFLMKGDTYVHSIRRDRIGLLPWTRPPQRLALALLRWPFCFPFVLWFATTGTIIPFKPQIERYLDKPYDHLSILQRSTANAQVQAALAAVPGSTFDSYELPHTSTLAAQILVDNGVQQFRVYVHPQTLQARHG